MFNSVHHTLGTFLKRMRQMSYEMKQIAGQELLCSILEKWREILNIFMKVVPKNNVDVDVDVKVWLYDVQNVFDNLKDILDEFELMAARQSRTTGKKTSLMKIIPARFTGSNPNAVLDGDLSSNIMVITNNLEELDRKRNALGLRVPYSVEAKKCEEPKNCDEAIAYPGSVFPSEPAIYGWNRDKMYTLMDTVKRLKEFNTKRDALEIMTYSAPAKVVIKRGLDSKSERTIYGRDEDKMKILDLVLRDEPSDANFSIIPIIGIAGVGKTTLAQLVYTDKAVEDFKPKAWVSVSEDSDIFRISKAILESITSRSYGLKNLNEVLVQLKEALVGRKFLLVLDDVLSKNHGLWETLTSSLIVGAPGSKVIMTTRGADLMISMESNNIQPYNLEVLPDDDCWSVFAKYAFGRDCDACKDLNYVHNYEFGRTDHMHKTSKLIREQIVQKCRGLPLTARILGSLLCSKRSHVRWEYLLKSEIWDSADDSEILPGLKLSYQDLSPNSRVCFDYCAILPRDYEFEEKELVHLWMAEGILGDSWDKEHMEGRGRWIFKDLLERSLLQRSSSNVSKFKMHDLVKNMTQWASGEIDFRVEDISGANEQARKFRRTSCYYTCASCDGINKFEELYEIEHLRTFLPGLLCRDDTHYITDELLSQLLPKMGKLRALSLEKQNITELPNSVEGLRYLRYANLSNTLIKRLPDSVCSLLLLQILLLRDCSRLIELPSDLRDLINLRHLDISGVNLIKEMPFGMEELKRLQILLNFVVGKGRGSYLNCLKKLTFLHEVYISGLHNVIAPQDTEDFLLIDKMYLKVLLLEWESQLDDTRNQLVQENVLDVLQPHANLEVLNIKGYNGTRFSSWVGDSTYSKMVVLTLERCEKCTVLPSLGCLGSLKHLTIKGMTGIKRIGSEIFGKYCSNPFKSLETLCFEDLQEWEHWDPVKENEHVEVFSCLRELSLLKCPKLSGKIPELDLFQFKLTIQECGHLEVSFPVLPMVL